MSEGSIGEGGLKTLCPRFVRIDEDGQDRESYQPDHLRFSGIHLALEVSPGISRLPGQTEAFVVPPEEREVRFILSRDESAPEVLTRVRGQSPLSDGDTFCIGKQYFRFDRNHALTRPEDR